ncbi:hypothetical protein ANCCEY_02153 [Ancylostoma ceylanicum]|uniref:Receptor ligand binding region domain-containing protein n=1 Tax=Ancylostoma ceylanicum TaxID=53326 RepID=A0A0D6M5K7_9BILA|nr:hypothetical protein ANCCEY_02153 [Ancylostoma ceylanicum]
MEQTIAFLREGVAQCSCCQTPGCNKKSVPVVAIVGPGKSSATIAVQNLLQVFRIPQIGYSATTPDLSDKEQFGYFMRVVPSDVWQARAINRLLHHYNWTYIAVLYSAGNYGEKGFEALERLLNQKKSLVCVAYSEKIKSLASEAEYKNVLKSLAGQKSRPQVVVCFCEGLTIRNFFQAQKELIKRNKSFKVPGFRAYYSQLNPENNTVNPWFREFWQQKFGCQFAVSKEDKNNENIRICTGTEDLDKEYKEVAWPVGSFWNKGFGARCFQDPKLSQVINSIRVVAFGLKAMYQDRCRRFAIAMTEASSSRDLDGSIIESDEDEENVEPHDEERLYELVVPFEDDSSDEEETDVEDAEDEWFDDISIKNRFPFTDSHGVNSNVISSCREPIDFYNLFLNESVLELMVCETNRYGSSKNTDWVLTNKEEISKLIALTMQMGIVRLPSFRSYWSNDPIYGCNRVGSNVMPRNRFEKLITNLHFCDNSAYDGSDRLYKIAEFVSAFNKACQDSFRPGREVCIDESLVPFRGRIAFRQYIPGKRHRYGIKLFKLCTEGGYTYRTIIYAGKETHTRVVSVAEKVVMALMDGLLDAGRLLFTDNHYTSIPLAETLIARKTNLVGTLRRNRKWLPSTVVGQKLKKGQCVAQQKKKRYNCTQVERQKGSAHAFDNA